MSLAWSPTWASPISPWISALGTRAATESITITSSAPLLTSISHISSACSPVSGWETSRFSTSTPKFFAYIGSRACSASINAALPPVFWASATIWRVSVVLPDDSGPNISTILPFGTPPMPVAMSRLMEPVDMASTFICAPFSPSFIIEPLPNCFCICAIAASRALSLSLLSARALLFVTSLLFAAIFFLRAERLFLII